MYKILKRAFYERETLTVAGELLGKILKFNNFYVKITEVEAYIGKNDLACHASKGLTKRTEVMFGKAGFSYIYLIYGMYHCLNIVTEEAGFPAAILIRGAKVLNNNILINGPGKLCKTLTINKQHNNLDLTVDNNFCVYDSSTMPNYICTPRIGITKSKEKFWRFLVNN